MQLLRFNIKPNSLIQYWLTANQETLYIILMLSMVKMLHWVLQMNMTKSFIFVSFIPLIWMKSRKYYGSQEYTTIPTKSRLRQSFDKLFAHEPDKFSRLYYDF